MTTDELLLKAEEAIWETLASDDTHIPDALRPVIGPALDAKDAEIDRLRMELSVLENFRDDDRKALQEFSCWDGSSDLWAELIRQRDQAKSENAELRQKFTAQTIAANLDRDAAEMRRYAERYRDLRTVGCAVMNMTAEEFDRECDRKIAESLKQDE